MGRERITLANKEETLGFGRAFAARLREKEVLALYGELGAGKTTFVQGLLEGLGIEDVAQSPTFTYLQVYSGKGKTVYHFDLYWLGEEREFVFLGFEELLDQGDCVVIEWPDRIPSFLPKDGRSLHFSYLPSGRTVELC